MVKLDWLRIHRFRWVLPGSELRFRPGINAIIGRNGTGKTTLLELLGAVWAGDFSAYAEEEFDLEYRFVGEGSSVEMRVENRRVEAKGLGRSGEVFLWKVAARMEWIYRGERRAYEGTVEVEGSYKRIYTASYEVNQVSIRGLNLDAVRIFMDGFDPISVGGDVHFRFGQAAVLGFVNVEGPGLDASQSERADQGPECPTLHGEMIGLRRYPEGGEGLETFTRLAKFHGFRFGKGKVSVVTVQTQSIPGDLAVSLEASIERPPFPPYATVAAMDGTSVIFLSQATSILEFKDIELRFDLELGDPRPDGYQPFSYGDLAVFFTKRDGARLKLDKLSHGQKRLFGFLWYLACSPQVAIADELSNGMHYAMAEAALNAIGDRQAFLAIQDPMLLDALTFDSAEEVSRGFVSCAIAEEAGRERWKWASFTAAQASTFFDAYEVNVQHVHEILRTWGLW